MRSYREMFSGYSGSRCETCGFPTLGLEYCLECDGADIEEKATHLISIPYEEPYEYGSGGPVGAKSARCAVRVKNKTKWFLYEK